MPFTFTSSLVRSFSSNPLRTTTLVPTCSINRYYDSTTDSFISVDQEMQSTDQEYVFTNDNPLNATDPLGLCSEYVPLLCPNPSPANKKPKPTVDTAVTEYISASTNAEVNADFFQVCANLVIIDGCLAVTAKGAIYNSVGVGLGWPGIAASANQTRGQSADVTLTGWSTCADGSFFVGGQHCWNTPGSGTSNGLEVSNGAGVGIFVNFGRRGLPFGL